MIIKAKKRSRSDPSILTAAIKKAAEEHARSTKRVEETLERVIEEMRKSDPPEEIDELDIDR